MPKFTLREIEEDLAKHIFALSEELDLSTDDSRCRLRITGKVSADKKLKLSYTLGREEYGLFVEANSISPLVSELLHREGFKKIHAPLEISYQPEPKPEPEVMDALGEAGLEAEAEAHAEFEESPDIPPAVPEDEEDIPF